MASNYQQRDPCVLPNLPQGELDNPTLHNFFQSIITAIPELVKSHLQTQPPVVEDLPIQSALGFDLTAKHWIETLLGLRTDRLKDDGSVISIEPQRYSFPFGLADNEIAHKHCVSGNLISKQGDILPNILSYAPSVVLTQATNLIHKKYALGAKPLRKDDVHINGIFTYGDIVFNTLEYSTQELAGFPGYPTLGAYPTAFATYLMGTSIINYYLYHTYYIKYESFTSDSTWTIPDNVYKIYIIAVGGTASGECVDDGTGDKDDDNSHAGGGAGAIELEIEVGPHQTLDIHVGAGGVWQDTGGGTGPHVAGTDTSIELDGNIILTAPASVDEQGVNGGTDGLTEAECDAYGPSDAYYTAANSFLTKAIRGTNFVLGYQPQIPVSGHYIRTIGNGGFRYTKNIMNDFSLFQLKPRFYRKPYLSTHTWEVHEVGNGGLGHTSDYSVQNGTSGEVIIYY